MHAHVCDACSVSCRRGARRSMRGLGTSAAAPRYRSLTAVQPPCNRRVATAVPPPCHRRATAVLLTAVSPPQALLAAAPDAQGPLTALEGIYAELTSRAASSDVLDQLRGIYHGSTLLAVRRTTPAAAAARHHAPGWPLAQTRARTRRVGRRLQRRVATV